MFLINSVVIFPPRYGWNKKDFWLLQAKIGYGYPMFFKTINFLIVPSPPHQKNKQTQLNFLGLYILTKIAQMIPHNLPLPTTLPFTFPLPSPSSSVPIRPSPYPIYIEDKTTQIVLHLENFMSFDRDSYAFILYTRVDRFSFFCEF